jgi:hypothetical protein
VLAVDKGVVARHRIHRQSSLRGIPVVVPVDEVVHLAEVPALGERVPRLWIAAT